MGVSSNFQIVELQDVLEGFVNNMGDAEIDENLRFFAKVARHFRILGKNYDHVAMVTGNDDWILKYENLPPEVKALDPVVEEKNGVVFAYFKDTDDAEQAVEVLDRQIAIENGEEEAWKQCGSINRTTERMDFADDYDDI